MAATSFSKLTFLTLVIVLMVEQNRSDLEGELMKMAELNGAKDLHTLKVFECMDRVDCQVGNPSAAPSCAERRRMVGLSENAPDKYVIVAAETDGTVQLDCHYCNEHDDESVPKVWYYYEKFLASKRFKIVPLHLDYPEWARKFVVTEDHRLLIRNFTESDGALYFCQGVDDTIPKFNFLVDAVDQSSDLEPKRGSLQDYNEYYATNIAPLNKKLQAEYKNDLKNWFVNSSDTHNYNVSHKWTNWGSCRSCGRPHGMRMRTGTCQLSIPTLSTGDDKKVRGSEALDFGYRFSCHSTMLKRFLTSKLRKKVNAILDFIEELPCDGACAIPGVGVDESAQASSRIASAQILTVVGTIGEELTLRCSQNPSADIVWLKNNVLLTLPEKSSSRSKVMTYTKSRGGIHFPALNTTDEGNYTCIVDDLVKAIFKLDTQDPVEPPPIPETWIWVHFGAFSLACFLIWIIIVVFIARVSWRTRKDYQPLSNDEETFLKRKRALTEGLDDQYIDP